MREAIPGIENFAPDRHARSKALSVPPNCLPVAASNHATAAKTSSQNPAGMIPSLAMNALPASVVMVKPGEPVCRSASCR